MNFSNLKFKFNSKQVKTWLYSSLAVASLVGLGVASFTIFEGNSMVAEAFEINLSGKKCFTYNGVGTGEVTETRVSTSNDQDTLSVRGWAVRKSDNSKKAKVELKVLGINGTDYGISRSMTANRGTFDPEGNIDGSCRERRGFEFKNIRLPAGTYKVEVRKNDEGSNEELTNSGEVITIVSSRMNNYSNNSRNNRNEPKKSDDYSSNRNNSGISNVERLQQVKQEAGGSQFELYYSGTIRDASGNRIPNKDNITLTRINGRRNSDLGKLVQLHADSFNTSAGSKTHMQVLRDSGTIYQNQNGNWWMDLDKLASGIQM